MSVMNFYIVVINKGQYTKHMLRGPRLADKNVAKLVCLGIKLKKCGSGFDLVTVDI